MSRKREPSPTRLYEASPASYGSNPISHGDACIYAFLCNDYSLVPAREQAGGFSATALVCWSSGGPAEEIGIFEPQVRRCEKLRFFGHPAGSLILALRQPRRGGLPFGIILASRRLGRPGAGGKQEDLGLCEKPIFFAHAEKRAGSASLSFRV